MGGGGLLPGDVRKALENVAQAVTMDGRGDVFFADYFQHGLSAWALGPGAGNTIDLSTVFTRGRDFALRFVTTDPNTSLITHLDGLSPVATFGAEAAFRVADANAGTQFLRIVTNDGTNQITFRVSINYVLQQITILNGAGGETVVAAASSPAGISLVNLAAFRRVKFTINRSTGAYGRLLFDASIFDISATLGQSVVNAGAPRQSIVFQSAAAGAGLTTTLYLDHIIETLNEP